MAEPSTMAKIGTAVSNAASATADWIGRAASATADGAKNGFNGLVRYSQTETLGGLTGGLLTAGAAIGAAKLFLGEFLGGILVWPGAIMLAIAGFFIGSRGGREVIDPWFGTGGTKQAAVQSPQQQIGMGVAPHQQQVGYESYRPTQRFAFGDVHSTYLGALPGYSPPYTALRSYPPYGYPSQPYPISFRAHASFRL